MRENSAGHRLLRQVRIQPTLREGTKLKATVMMLNREELTMRQPGIFDIASIEVLARTRSLQSRIAGQPYRFKRFYAAWLVFTGRADVLTWTQRT